MIYQENLFGRGAPDDEAIKMIQFYEGLALQHDPRGYCVCTSEGKDSRVLGHLMRRAGVKHFYAHSITGIDPPELIYFQRRNFEEYRRAGYLAYEIRPQQSFWSLMRKAGILPTRKCRYCCRLLKERQTTETEGALMCLGVRKAESANRAKNRDELEIVANGRNGRNIIMAFDNDENRRTFETCYARCEKRVNPIAYWTDCDIWEYIRENKLEQCSLYYEGFSRLGCIGCPLTTRQNRERQFERWPGFKRLFIRTLDLMLQDRRAAGKQIDEHRNTAEKWFDNWMQDKWEPEVDEDQLMLELGV